MSRYFDAFDNTYAKGYLIGEMIWNFADFATKQGPLFKKEIGLLNFILDLKNDSAFNYRYKTSGNKSKRDFHAGETAESFCPSLETTLHPIEPLKNVICFMFSLEYYSSTSTFVFCHNKNPIIEFKH